MLVCGGILGYIISKGVFFFFLPVCGCVRACERAGFAVGVGVGVCVGGGQNPARSRCSHYRSEISRFLRQ